MKDLFVIFLAFVICACFLFNAIFQGVVDTKFEQCVDTKIEICEQEAIKQCGGENVQD